MSKRKKFINKEYLTQVIEKSKTYLKKEYNFDTFGFNDFEMINAYLLNKAIFSNDFNLLVRTPDVEGRRSLYVPVILITAIFSFYKNYVNYNYLPQAGEIVQEKIGLRYRINEISNGWFHLESNDKYKTKRQVDEAGIKKFYVTTGGISEMNIKQNFGLYEEVFNWVFPGIGHELPSKFKYKSVIVTEKKMMNELSDFKINSKKIYKAIPFQYFTKTGTTVKNLPIDPMIYITNDYETVREFIFNTPDTKIDNIIFTGAAKYKDELINIKGDLRQEKFNNAIFIGESNIETFPHISKWNWTPPELKNLNSIEQTPINVLDAANDSLSQCLKDFYELIKSIEKKYSIELMELRIYARKLFSVIIPSSHSRLINQIEENRAIFEKTCDDILTGQFYRINQAYGDCALQLKESYKTILKAVSTNESKVNGLKNAAKGAKYNYLVVPQNLKQPWDEETEKLGIEKVTSISYKEFQELPEDKIKSIIFLSLYGYEFFKTIINSSHRISIILFKEEKARWQYYFERYKGELALEFSSPDRKHLIEIDYPGEKRNDAIAGMIERYYFEDAESSAEDFENQLTENIEYQIIFDDNDSKICDSNRSIILLKNGQKRKERISNLIPGDKVIIYENITKGLYEIAVEEDKEGRFQEFEKDSRIWKSALNHFFNRSCFGNIETLFEWLKRNGLNLKAPSSLRRWLNNDDEEKFPASTQNLIAIKKTIKNNMLDKSFDSIIRSRRSYRSIMIALGKDLSNEIMDYVLSDSKEIGKILSHFSDLQIKKFIDINAPKRIIKKIKIVESNHENE